MKSLTGFCILSNHCTNDSKGHKIFVHSFFILKIQNLSLVYLLPVLVVYILT